MNKVTTPHCLTGAHTASSNMADARFVINDWAKMLVKGLNRAKGAPAP